MLAPMQRAAWVTMPHSASVATNARCRAGPIELRRGALCGTGRNPSSGSSGASGSPRKAMYEVPCRAMARVQAGGLGERDSSDTELPPGSELARFAPADRKADRPPDPGLDPGEEAKRAGWPAPGA